MRKYTSPADIAEMKARGYEASTIEAAEERLQKWCEAQKVCRTLEEAFARVKLGNGVSLRQTQALDDYADAWTLASCRDKDEKDDWQRLPLDVLNCYSWNIGYLDAEGMRFHLPAYLIANLQGKLEQDDTLHAVLDELDNSRQFGLFDSTQRTAVQAYLSFVANNDGDLPRTGLRGD